MLLMAPTFVMKFFQLMIEAIIQLCNECKTILRFRDGEGTLRAHYF